MGKHWGNFWRRNSLESQRIKRAGRKILFFEYLPGGGAKIGSPVIASVYGLAIFPSKAL